MSGDASTLAAELAASRARSTRITSDLDGERLLGPQIAIVNPPLWELGHLAWFQEFWCLRHRNGAAPSDSILAGADALFDSAKVAHATRWTLPLPSLQATRAYQADVLGLVARRLEKEPGNGDLLYFADLAAFHEDMHAEAFHYTRQTLGYPDPLPAGESAPAEAGPAAQGDAQFGGGSLQLGAGLKAGFVFDNEKWAHEVRVPPFRIARTAVTNAQYAAFVEEGGYARSEFWSEAGWAWRGKAAAEAPRYWHQEGRTWRLRRFDRTVALPPDHPVLHVNWHEAQAYCRFAHRRLPTEAEWEYAASMTPEGKRRFPWGDASPDARHANLQAGGTVSVHAYPEGDSAGGCRQLIGNAWEWTASAFEPYPGFVVDPYKEYSQPWFGTHKVLRGGSFATPRRLIRSTWRNFYTPDRGDIFAGFRTCAVE